MQKWLKGITLRTYHFFRTAVSPKKKEMTQIYNVARISENILTQTGTSASESLLAETLTYVLSIMH